MYARSSPYSEREDELLFLTTMSTHEDAPKLNVSVSNAVYIQEYNRFIACPLCEIDAYEHIFNLENDEKLQLRQYMRYWSILRQCCGFQQSLNKRKSLHRCGVNSSSYAAQGSFGFHDCFTRNISSVEEAFTHTYLFRLVPPVALAPSEHLDFHWQSPGDCARIDAEIQSGLDFNKVNETPCHR